ncbi:signal peptide peptidase SppA [Prevotella sp. E13-27]|uniref:signal peptide peptidase SppA n=1 Tax=Prevotella sp. E13-27 TaxID=2938122 RepID=UPI00200A48C8|nr:signal peptide peptidase SppA [Prevotella sp. E13-27]MCK8622655.1 signal peptide peptidase SppA [Prevotella sp. E13-27]
MKEFFKYTLATICGIVLLSVISGIMFMISIVGMIASESASTQVKDNSVFVIKLSGILQERSEDNNPFSSLLGNDNTEQMGLDELICAINKAKDNEDIKGIYLEGGLLSFDAPASAQQLRDALVEFKKSGKWIIAYADQYMQMSYYVASVADSVFLNTTGMIDFKGLGGKSQYMTGLYEKLGIKMQATRVGKYKSAIESVTRKDMSDDDREQRTAYLQGVWKHMLKDIADSRKVSTEQLNQLASDSIIAFADANDYIKAHLVDKLMYPEEIKTVVKAKLGIDDDDDINQLLLSDMAGVDAKKKEKGDEIAIYYAYGEIIDSNAGGLFPSHSIVGNKTVEDIAELADDDDIKAVVLRVNSPGGSAIASEQIWHAIELLKAKKPVVVSMGGLAASGGYMISAGANYIVAEPTTLTGSIGIFGLIPNLTGLATDKLGITFDGVKTNRFTDYEDNLVFSKENEAELLHMQHYVDRGYEKFLSIVAQGRKMSRDEVHTIAQGRVWLASDAINIKLVDQLGSLDDAIKKAAELAKSEKYYTTAYPGQEDWMDNLFKKDEKGSYLDSQLRTILGDFYEPIMEMRLDQQRNRLQARLPFTTTIR